MPTTAAIATAGWRMLTFYLSLALGSIIFLIFNIADARTRRLRRQAVSEGG